MRIHDISHFPGEENPLIKLSVPTSETTDGITAYDTLGYASPPIDSETFSIESLDQHDILNHPPVPTISGVDHVNPRGQIQTDGLLDVPEKSVGYSDTEDAVQRVLDHNRRLIPVRIARPPRFITRLVQVAVTDPPFLVAAMDDSRDRVRVSINYFGSGQCTVVLGSFAEVSTGNGYTLDTFVTGLENGVEFHHTDDIWLKNIFGGIARVSVLIERWDD
jgi:hypothetical protein